MKPVWVYEAAGKRCNIFHDADVENPRTAFQNYGHLYTWTTRNDYGDNHDISADDFDGWEGLKTYLETEFKPVILLPVYMYKHSGIALSAAPFGDHWDSGQIGFIWCAEEDIRNGGLEVTPQSLEIVRQALINELELYEAWLNGSCYGYELIDAESGAELDTCWGYYGFNFKENGLLDNAFGDEAVNAKEVRCS